MNCHARTWTNANQILIRSRVARVAPKRIKQRVNNARSIRTGSRSRFVIPRFPLALWHPSRVTDGAANERKQLRCETCALFISTRGISLARNLSAASLLCHPFSVLWQLMDYGSVTGTPCCEKKRIHPGCENTLRSAENALSCAVTIFSRKK